MLQKLWNYLQGKKSYLTAAAMLVYAVASVYLGKMNWEQAIAWLLGSSALVSVKSALVKVQEAAGE